jgi:hypothetical protein
MGGTRFTHLLWASSLQFRMAYIIVTGTEAESMLRDSALGFHDIYML